VVRNHDEETLLSIKTDTSTGKEPHTNNNQEERPTKIRRTAQEEEV
jgi:hypothetical protein